MPKLPTAEQLGARPTPSPRGGIAPLRLETPQLGQEARAVVDLGEAVKGLGDTIAIMAEKEKKELDATRRREAVTNYSGGLLELEDGPGGFSSVLGGDAVKNNLPELYREKRSALRKKIRESLGNKEQQMGFDAEADIADRQFDGRLYRHVSGQSQAYGKLTYDSAIETAGRLAAKNWDVPGELDISTAQIKAFTLTYARQRGLDPERPADKEAIDNLVASNLSKMHVGVMETMLMQGKDQAAEAYYKRIEKDLTPEARVALGSKVQSAAIDGNSMRYADEIWASQGPEELNGAVRLDIMDATARRRFQDDPRMAKKVIDELHNRAAVHNDAQREVTNVNESAVLDAFNQGKTLKEIQAMSQYRDLDGTTQAKLSEYINNMGYTQEQRRRAQFEYEEGEKSRISFGRYLDLSNPNVLASMTEAQIKALEPEMGQKLTLDLMNKYRSLKASPQAVHDANIDANLFNALAADAGLDPYSTKLSADQKAQLGRLKNEVEAVIDEAQRSKGGKMTRAEKEEAMKQVIQRQVKLSRFILFSDPKVPAAIVSKEQRASAYVPLKEIDRPWLKGAINYMRSSGQVPLQLSDNEIIAKYRSRLERAAGWARTGGDAETGKKILEGKE